MKFSYKFSNLLGTVYRKGNLTFSPDGNRIISPVGNRISVFDLKNNKSETLPVESSLNITAIALSPAGNLMIAVNENGDALLISLLTRTVLNEYKFHRPVNAISFSPDGKKFAVTKENNVLVFHSPGQTREFNPFVLYRTFYGAYDETVSIDWTTDSQAFCVGCKDMNTRIYGAHHFTNLIIYSVGGHSDCIVNAFFDNNSLDVYTVGQKGQLCIWECDTDLDGLIPYQPSDDEDSDEEEEEEDGEEKKSKSEDKKSSKTQEEKILYKRIAKHSFKSARGEGAPFAMLTSAAYHKNSHILVTGFQDGAFFLHEMPDFNLIHSLSISDQVISSVAFNRSGDWIGIGCSGLGQLLVWEWQSESYVLKQQGHFNNMSCLAYSPDGQHIVTGGDDGKVKVWSPSTGFCFVTFTEHNSGITGVTFNHNGQVVVSCSLDGTVRAFDLNRYRNFRTFTSPHPVQFASLTLDPSGDIVCAGGLDNYDIYVWSMQTGRLLEVLSGHEGPVSSLSFSNSHTILASGSWDKTVKLWDIFERKGARETLELNSDVTAVAYRPDGSQLAVATLNAQITFWDVHNATQTGTVEGRHDLGYTRNDTDKVTAKKASAAKAFTSVCYTADGKSILAGGRSKNICIYSVTDQILMKKFAITCNRSLDGVEEFLDRRKMTEWGSLALVDDGKGDGDDKISLPGVRKGDHSSRHFKPEVRVTAVQFSPTGRAWVAACTEGLLVYSLDHNLVFDPFELELDITPENVKKTLAQKDHKGALMLSLRLNDQRLIQQVVESTPASEIQLLSSTLPDVYIDKLLNFVAAMLESSPHIEFYLTWCHTMLMSHGPKLKQRSQDVMSVLTTLQKNLTVRHTQLGKICDHNKYSLQYIKTLSQTKKKRPPPEDASAEEDEDSNMEADDSDEETEGILSLMRMQSDE